MLQYNNIDIHWLGHDSFLIKSKEKVIYIDPFKLSRSDLPKADIIITTHEHFDHCNPDSINLISTDETALIGSTNCLAIFDEKVQHKKSFLELKPGETVEVDGIQIKAYPAYNINKFREPGKHFHPKEAGHIGPLLNIDGTKIFHTGDADNIPEFKDIKPDIAMVPVSGTYVMTVEEAVEAAKIIDADITIPMHIGRGIGEISYLEDFKKKLSGKRVEVLELEEDM